MEKHAEEWGKAGAIGELLHAAYNLGVEESARVCDRWANDDHQVACSYWVTCNREIARSIRSLIKPSAARTEGR